MSRDPNVRKQCKACPWKRSVVASRDIPNGYCSVAHARLRRTIVEDPLATLMPGVLRLMACHETPIGREQPCVGWLHNQLGPGNNLALRFAARGGRFGELVLDGPQHETFEETLT